MKKTNLERIVESGYCTGCGLCAGLSTSGAVEMKMSRSGHFRPLVIHREGIPDQEVIDQVCPGIHLDLGNTDAEVDLLWGPLKMAATAHAVDPEVRHKGSSGGVISAIAIHLIESRTVDFVAQIAASETDPLANELQLSKSRGEILYAGGSRYGPSAPLATFNALLERGQRFALIGKPCDVAAIRQLARLDPRVNQLVKVMISFMCAGVPSQQGTHELLRELNIEREQVVAFRYRGEGWPGMARAVDRQGKAYEMDYGRSWGTILNKHLQFRCKICPDGTGEFADIVCADAWYGENGYPEFQERDGRSLVLARTERGAALLESVIKNDLVRVEGLDLQDLQTMQPYQAERKRFALSRLIGNWLRKGWGPKYRNLRVVECSIGGSLRSQVRNAVGTYRRANSEAKS